MSVSSTSYPRNKIKILLLENISDSAAAELYASGYLEIERLNGALSEDQLVEAVKGVHLIGIRSKTQINAKVIDAADKLLAIGCFCIGVNQVDLKAATEKGVAVFNAPHANTRSVAELVIGLCVMLIRKMSEKNAAAHRGEWLKEAQEVLSCEAKRSGSSAMEILAHRSRTWPRQYKDIQRLDIKAACQQTKSGLEENGVNQGHAGISSRLGTQATCIRRFLEPASTS